MFLVFYKPNIFVVFLVFRSIWYARISIELCQKEYSMSGWLHIKIIKISSSMSMKSKNETGIKCWHTQCIIQLFMAGLGKTKILCNYEYYFRLFSFFFCSLHIRMHVLIIIIDKNKLYFIIRFVKILFIRGVSVKPSQFSFHMDGPSISTLTWQR